MSTKLVLYLVGIAVYYIYKEYKKQQEAAQTRMKTLEQGLPEVPASTVTMTPPPPPVKTKPVREALKPVTNSRLKLSKPNTVTKSSYEAIPTPVIHSLEQDGEQHLVHYAMQHQALSHDDAYTIPGEADLAQQQTIWRNSQLYQWFIGSEILSKPAYLKY